MDREVHVIFAFNPANYFDLIYALGKSSRSHHQKCDGTLIISDVEDFKKLELDKISNYYYNIEKEQVSNETLRMNLLKIGHGKI
jgi:hypothetical protein